MSDYAIAVVHEPLVVRINELAPGVRLSIDPMTPQTRTSDRVLLDYDALVAPLGFGFAGESRPLWQDRMVCLVDRRNSRLQDGGLTLQDLRALPHAVAWFGPGTLTPVDRVFGELGIERRIEVMLTGWLALPFVLEGTDLVAVVPERLARIHTEAGPALVQVEPPFGLRTAGGGLLVRSRPTGRSGARLAVRPAGRGRRCAHAGRSVAARLAQVGHDQLPPLAAQRPARAIGSGKPLGDGAFALPGGPESAARRGGGGAPSEPVRGHGGDIRVSSDDPPREQEQPAKQPTGATRIAEDIGLDHARVDTGDLDPGIGNSLGQLDGEEVIGELRDDQRQRDRLGRCAAADHRSRECRGSGRRWRRGRVARTGQRPARAAGVGRAGSGTSS